MASDLITRSIADQVKAAQRAYDLAARFGRGEISASALYEEGTRFATQETTRYASDLATLSLNYYADWLALSQRYSSRFFDTFGAAGQAAPAQARNAPAERTTSREAPAARRVEMDLHAPLGQEAARAFVLENKRGASADISFNISEFLAPGRPAFRPALRIEPERFTLEAGQEITVTLHLPMQPDHFSVGERCRASVQVNGYDNLELALTVWADAPLEAQTSKAPAVSSDKPAAKPVRRSRRKDAGGG